MSASAVNRAVPVMVCCVVVSGCDNSQSRLRLCVGRVSSLSQLCGGWHCLPLRRVASSVKSLWGHWIN